MERLDGWVGTVVAATVGMRICGCVRVYGDTEARMHGLEPAPRGCVPGLKAVV